MLKRSNSSFVLPVKVITALLLLFTLFLLPTQHVYAQSQFASVNLALVYNFHPLVQSYVPDVGYFIKGDQNTDFKARYEKNKSQIRKLQLEINEVYRQIEALKQEDQKAEVETWRQRRRIETEMEAWSANPSNEGKTKDFSKEKNQLAELQKKAEKTAEGIKEKRSALYSKAIEINNQLKGINYYVGDENEKLVKKIVSEVSEIIKSIAQQKNCAIVINSTQFNALRRKREKTALNTYNPALEDAPVNIYSEEYTNRNFLNEHKNEGAEYAKAALDQRMHLYQQMMGDSDEFTAPFAGRGINDLLIMGGTDITADVLKTLLIKYKVDKTVIQLMSVGVSSGQLY